MVKMKGKKIKFIQYGIILLILLFLSGILLVLKYNQERNYNMNRWNNSINNIVHSKDKVTKIQILNFTPSGETKYDVEREKYDEYIKFMKSVKVAPCNDELLSGISTQFTVQYKDETEFRALFIGKYINIDNKYCYEIQNYSEIKNKYNDLILLKNTKT